MVAPTLAVIIPTIGRLSLARTLASTFAAGLRPGDEVIVVGDTTTDQYDADLDRADLLCDVFGAPVRYVEHANPDGVPDFGHGGLNHALREQVTADYTAQLDDDDVWMPGAITAIHADLDALPAPRVLLYIFQTPGDYRVPDVRVRPQDIHLGGVSGQSIVTPSRHLRPDWLGTWEPDYCGDFQYVDSVMKRAGYENVILRDVFTVRGRPLDWVECWNDARRIR